MFLETLQARGNGIFPLIFKLINKNIKYFLHLSIYSYIYKKLIYRRYNES
ncbi:hypothetical protein MFUM_270058 [Methylacidiphilum fumariolicum SolV]|uniref:Uncharacterized protein n=2 Tax=Candidatus Methylacidiphilum fumarolicum TaxID=591154 RepID=I0JXJ1_METFB|nr:conserved protein of unknown function [Candidatus Methylacidiphilum fumarolicum]CCG91960.1 hypothetical protein MFUM_270058 [Methylacidiphilum fumariolicum SolV]